MLPCQGAVTGYGFWTVSKSLKFNWLSQQFCLVPSMFEEQVPLGTVHIVTTEFIPLPPKIPGGAPRLPLLWQGELLLRSSERQKVERPNHQPPRYTRYIPVEGPIGLFLAIWYDNFLHPLPNVSAHIVIAGFSYNLVACPKREPNWVNNSFIIN